ncbi:hypothetical protein B0537_08845 [Desulforamulus ferrireducens]|uniref:Uncharacterized protein n=2 Tax=Desulforamulus ferrireducens TaxID=1833852 RepID=A0A1S6IWN3_9FIRM|nr:hypothetical protein B0537_08845 [Desulforamulus ferrireducens]
MSDMMAYTIALTICLIGLVELVLERELKFVFGLLGIAGAILIGLFIKNHHWYELSISLFLLLPCGYYLKTYYYSQT